MRRSLLAGLATALLLAAPGFGSSARAEVWQSLGWVNIPGNPLTSFDISWVDNDISYWFLADRSNVAVDLFAIAVNPTVFQLHAAAPGFAGNVTTCPVSNACNGPNGVITLTNPGTSSKELWVGNGPTMASVCTTSCSTVVVYNSAAAQIKTIPTGGTFRADELCFAPVNPTTSGGVGNVGNGSAHGMVAIANDSDSPPFVSFIPTDGLFAYTVIAKLNFLTASNGIEQCQYDPRVHRIFLNIPEEGGLGFDTEPGHTVVIDANDIVKGVAPTLDGDLTIPLGGGTLNGCAGPQGMAILDVPTGPNAGVGILLGCNQPSPGPGDVIGQGMAFTGTQNSVVIENDVGLFGTASIIHTFFGQGGADEVWFDGGAGKSNRMFLANGQLGASPGVTQSLGINDGLTNAVVQNIFVGFTNGTTRRSHSVSAWSGPGLGSSVAAVFLPVSATGGSPAPGFQSSLCGSSAAAGCLAVFADIPIPTN